MKPTTISTSLAGSRCLELLSINTALIPIGGNKLLTGVIDDSDFRVSLRKTVLSIGWAAPTVTGSWRSGGQQTFITLRRTRPVLLNIGVGIMYSIGFVAALLTVLELVRNRSVSGFTVPGALFAGFGLVGGLFIRHADKIFASERDWHSLISAIASIVEGEIVTERGVERDAP